MARPTNFTWVSAEEADLGADTPGGLVRRYLSAGTLLVGDVVFLSAALTANKSAVEADYNKHLGVVVGGTQTGMEILQDDIDIGVNAALIGQEVWVCYAGKAKVVTGAAVTLGDKITGSTVTAGRVATASITTDLAAGDTGRLLGMALETAGGAGIIILAQIALH